MEHDAVQWLGSPSCQRGSYAFYKSVGSRAEADGPVQLWRLGEFYLIRCGPQEPLCIAEVTLLWEDQTRRRHLLASARLYFLPEDTPKGRTREHGEDEVLAVSRKMVLRVEDLVRWARVEPGSWSGRGTNGLLRAPERNGQPPTGKAAGGVRVLSYPQYCRFRSLQRRIQEGGGATGPLDAHLLALGGVRAPPNTHFLYCRDTFNHPTLEGSAGFSWQFRCPSLSLRGRPRKRRGRDDQDSSGSGQSESWIEKMKENVMGSVELGCEGSWLPDPEETLFLDQLFVFMERHGAPINKVPNLGFKKIDLFLMYSVVKRLGGYDKVTSDRLWKIVYNELGGCPGSTSAATCTRRHYERLMLPFEAHLRAGGAEFKVPESPPTPPRPPTIRGRKPGPRAKEKKTQAPPLPAPAPPPLAPPTPAPAPAPQPASEPDPPRADRVSEPAVTFDLPRPKDPEPAAVVKRGRGRPPGTRNKATLMAQAKLLAQQQARARAADTHNALLPARDSDSHNPPLAAHRPANLPLTPDLSPMSASFLPFQAKAKEASPSPAVLLSTLPRHSVGGALGGFSPMKGVCPLDVFRSRVGLQPAPESPARTPQAPAQLRATNGDQPQAPPHNGCSGCTADEGPGAQRGGRTRPPLPPLRVLPLNLDCSVQVCQLMRTRRLDSSQLQTFTRRLSEALSQDLSAKPPCSPMTPPPEQALPLNLSKRYAAKRAGGEGAEPSQDGVNGNGEPPSSKRPRGGGGAESGEDPEGRPASRREGQEQEVDVKNQEEPADLSSPSRIRAFLLGLPPFQVKFLTPGSDGETEPEKPEGGVKAERKDPEQQEEEEVKGQSPRSGPGPAALKRPGTSDTDAAHCC